MRSKKFSEGDMRIVMAGFLVSVSTHSARAHALGATDRTRQTVTTRKSPVNPLAAGPAIGDGRTCRTTERGPMKDHPSLFARKLRDWRARNGTHGRVTQEVLAEMLDVSVDAIGKYERSVSFIRGDLEHRLAERLGWSRDEVLACREDWEARSLGKTKTGFEVLDEALVNKVFAGSWRRAINEMIEYVEGELGDMPDELAANPDVFLNIYVNYPDYWTAILRDGQFVAKWGLLLLRSSDEAIFRQGRLMESELTVDGIHRPILPGTCFGYCPALVISRGHEAVSSLLLTSFVHFLEGLASRDILLHGIGTVSVSAGGAQICEDLGMTHLGNHFLSPEFGIWELPGAQIANSIFARRSSLLRRRYTAAFNA